MEKTEEVMIDVNQWAEGHDYFSLRSLSVSPNNKLLAFSVDTLSRRIYTIKVKNLETGDLLEDEIHGTEGSVAWANDNSTFFYTVKNKITLLSEHIDRHELGTPQSEDVRVFTESDDSTSSLEYTIEVCTEPFSLNPLPSGHAASGSSNT